MTTVYCFSGSGHSLAVARFFAEQLKCELRECCGAYEEEETSVVVFPVYCQNIPKPVKVLLRKLTSKYIVLIATYGRISYGNVLNEAQKLVQGQVIAGAYVPIGHTFLNGDCSFDSDALMPILKRIETRERVCIPRSFKNPLSNVFPAFRSRIGVKIIKQNQCSYCGICEKNCPMGAIKNGITNSKCIRCLRCVTNCPQNVLQYKNTPVLETYLESYYKDDFVLYL